MTTFGLNMSLGRRPNADLLAIMKIHRGRRSAITGKELARVLGERDDRLIRKAIRELIAAGHPIASSTEKPFGYFIIETRQEADHYLQQLKSRLVEDAYRRRDFRIAAFLALSEEKQLLLI